MSVLVVTTHAVRRYQSRVAALPHDQAEAAIIDLLSDARIRSTPRHWMRATTGYGSGVRFAYSPRAPRIGIVIRGRAVVTVIPRSLCRERLCARRPERRLERASRPKRAERRHRRGERSGVDHDRAGRSRPWAT